MLFDLVAFPVVAVVLVTTVAVAVHLSTPSAPWWAGEPDQLPEVEHADDQAAPDYSARIVPFRRPPVDWQRDGWA
jgi:hypothetical protein